MNVRDILETVRRVEIRTNRLVNDVMVGGYLSQFKGHGLDFEELREYIPGDDVRDIDWNVTNRMGRPFVKEYREERELGVILALDISASSLFGSGALSKREYAVEVAATLAFSAARNGDKVGLLLFSNRVELFVPPRKGRKHILRLIRDMLVHEAREKGTNIARALTFLNHVLLRKNIVFLMTDFLHSRGVATGVGEHKRDIVQEMGLTNIRHDLVCVHLHDAREQSLPDAGLATLEDAETGEILELDTHRNSIRETYREYNEERLASLDRALRRTGVNTIRLAINEPFAFKLQTFFEIRRKK